MGFLSTLSLRRATGNDRRGCWYSCYFYPRSPYGERRMSRCTVAGSCRFLSTLSLRRATLSKDAKDGPVLISLHALLTESDAKLTQKFEIRSKFLSTLSLRRATKRVQVKARRLQISIHALLTESDSKWSILKSRRMVFLSTLSLRRATWGLPENSPGIADFYPRSPCGERL